MAWRGHARGALPLALGSLAAAEVLRSHETALNARGSRLPEPLRSLSDALNGPPRRKHALGTMRHLAERRQRSTRG